MNSIIVLTPVLIGSDGKVAGLEDLAVTRNAVTCAKLRDLLNVDLAKPETVKAICRETTPPTET